jgi:hypothetical protein
MSKISLALVAVVVVATAMLTPSLIVRAQGTVRFEYARVTPYIERTVAETNPSNSFTTVQERVGYRACVAGVNQWACREFKPTESSTDALRIALVQLGNDGWELVSAAPEDGNVNTPALTYLFKRQTR